MSDRYREIYSNSFGIRIKDPSIGITRPYFIDRDEAVEKDRAMKERIDALVKYHTYKDDADFLIAVLKMFGVQVLDDPDIDTLRHVVNHKITNEADRLTDKGVRFVDAFVNFAKTYKPGEWSGSGRVTLADKHDIKRDKENDRITRKAINVQLYREKGPSIRFAHMISNRRKALAELVRFGGTDWHKAAYTYLGIAGNKDVIITDKLSGTLFDENTILIFDRTWKKPEPDPVKEPEPLWLEEDLVTSQLH